MLSAFYVAVAVAHLLAGASSQDNNRQGLLQSAKTVATSALEHVGKTIQAIEPLDNLVFSDCVEPPEECPNKNITFWYSSRSNPDNPVKISVSDPQSFEQLPKNEFPWKVLIHGYTKSKDEIPNPELKQAYFKQGNYNIISVDYSPVARNKCYLPAVHNVPLIARCTAQFIDTLVDKSYFKMNDLHVIGFSLGGQVSGQLYKYLKNGKPGRVTGLDPASPLFDGVVNPKLTEEAAEFVDVVHTNALFKGQLDRSGHADFYVNGGFNQPGCISQITNSSTCSHNRGPMYFAESINSREGFWGIPCSSYLKFFAGSCDTDESKLVIMGEYVPTKTRGTYYLKTTENPPFALGKKSRVA